MIAASHLQYVVWERLRVIKTFNQLLEHGFAYLMRAVWERLRQLRDTILLFVNLSSPCAINTAEVKDGLLLVEVVVEDLA